MSEAAKNVVPGDEIQPISSTEWRTHHTYPHAQYILPSDDEERARLALQHQLLKEIYDDALVLSMYTPLPNHSVLDSGTGSGIWLLDFAGQCSEEIDLWGIDIETSLYPHNPPLNVHLVKGTVIDLPHEWKDKFHFVHQRLLIAGLKSDEWTTAVRNIHRVLAPGGWAQLSEVGKLVSGNISSQFQDLKGQLMNKKGLLPDCTNQIPKILKEIGFIEVKAIAKDIPLGAWAGKCGIDARDNFIGVYRGMKKAFLKAGCLGQVSSAKEFDIMMDNVQDEWDRLEGSSVEFLTFVAKKE